LWLTAATRFVLTYNADFSGCTPPCRRLWARFPLQLNGFRVPMIGPYVAQILGSLSLRHQVGGLR
jgi:hypothetical protein